MNRRVLIVDDDATVLNSLALGIESYGFTAEKAESAIVALEILAASESPFQCIVLDYSMPEINGLAALQEIRKIGVSSPTVLCSGFDFDREDEDAHDHWPEATLSKPFRLNQLISTLEKLMDEPSET